MDVYDRFPPQAYNVEWGNKVSIHIDRIAEGNDMRAGIEVSREAYLNFLQIYVSANVMLVGL